MYVNVVFIYLICFLVFFLEFKEYVIVLENVIFENFRLCNFR